MKLTRLERQWILYDVGNSAFTLLIATILPIYFNALAQGAGLSETNYLAYWGYAVSLSTLLVALGGPVLGTLADQKGMKKPIFFGALLLGVAGCLAMGFVSGWVAFLAVFVAARVGYSASLIFYDAMLVDVTEESRVDAVSSYGYAWGYIGSCIPFVICLLLVLVVKNYFLAFAVVALWWLATSIPLLKNYRQRYFVPLQERPIRASFSRLWKTLKSAKKEKKVFLFLLAFFFYIDGVYTIIDMATAYGSALGLDSTGLLLALLVTQIVAFPFAILFGRLAQKVENSRLITLCIIAYLGIGVFAVFLHTQMQFWILAVLVGMFQGGIQALSRSYFIKIIPNEKSGEYFGLLDICGKGAAVMGTTLVSAVTQATGNASLGVGAIVILFVIGLFLFQKAIKL